MSWVGERSEGPKVRLALSHSVTLPLSVTFSPQLAVPAPLSELLSRLSCSVFVLCKQREKLRAHIPCISFPEASEESLLWFSSGEQLLCEASTVLKYVQEDSCQRGVYGRLVCTDFKISFLGDEDSALDNGGV